MSNNCYLCNEKCNIVLVQETLRYGNLDITVPDLEFYECPNCGVQFADADLDAENSKKIKDAKDANSI